jgi:hypothetical protein
MAGQFTAPVEAREGSAPLPHVCLPANIVNETSCANASILELSLGRTSNCAQRIENITTIKTIIFQQPAAYVLNKVQ